jgi:putative membrane protein
MCDLNGGFYNMMGGFWPGMMGGGWLGFGFGWIFMIVFWALIIWLIVFLVRKISGHSGCKCGCTNGGKCSCTNCKCKSGALLILQERYVKGEIDKEEFETKKKTLEN